MASVRAVTRAVDVLKCFTVEQPLMGVQEIGGKLRLSRPTLYRLLHTLEEAGLVQAEGDPLRFRLGPAIAPIAHVWRSTLDISRIAAPLLEGLQRDLKDTVSLFLRHGDKRVCVAEYTGSQGLMFVRGIGYVEELWRGASGLAMLAFVEAAMLDRILAEPEVRSRESEIRRVLPNIRAQGYAMTSSDIFPGALGVGAAIFDHAGEVAGAVGIAGAESAYDENRRKETAERILSAACRISEALGYTS